MNEQEWICETVVSFIDDAEEYGLTSVSVPISLLKTLAQYANAAERFVAFMDEWYSIRGKIEPLKSDMPEDKILKAIYADILGGGK